ncbi:MAG: hypothetical protein PHW11_01730 [Anaerolineaceae bacterium]|nr:hypothetical protein [Anaerolineaceae bacterium]MDD4041950.1 hypothetical protein [Anaerolineaceae bacterium]
MRRDILVALYSEDTYVLDWMSLLVVRDWRTRVVAELTSPAEMSNFFSQEHLMCDGIIIDIDNAGDLKQLAKQIEKTGHDLKLIGLCRNPEPDFFRYVPHSNIIGLLYKQEIETSLGWAITFAAEGQPVFTPRGLEDAWNANFSVPKERLVLRSRSYPGLTDRQSEIARLAIIFSIGRRDLADELKISDQWSYGVVSELYDHLGLSELLDENQDFNSILENDPVIKAHIDEILEDLGTSKKARDLETLAFHLLTMPVIE